MTAEDGDSRDDMAAGARRDNRKWWRVVAAGILLVVLLVIVQFYREYVDAGHLKVARKRLNNIALAANDVQQPYPPMGLPGHNGHLKANYGLPPLIPHAFWTDILPYLKQESLYQRIDHHKAWSDPINKAPLTTILNEYLHPGLSVSELNEQGYAVAHYAINGQVSNDIRAATYTHEILDGTSYTMLAGTVNDGFLAWGDPRNHRDPAVGFCGGPKAFGAPNGRIATIVMCDGSVRNVRIDLPLDICARIADPADGGEKPEF